MSSNATVLTRLLLMGVRLAQRIVGSVPAAEDVAQSLWFSLQPLSVIEFTIKDAATYLDKKVLNEVVEQNFPNHKALDEWVPRTDHQGRRSFVRAYAPRLVHVLPDNSPGMGIRSIAQSASVKR